MKFPEEWENKTIRICRHITRRFCVQKSRLCKLWNWSIENCKCFTRLQIIWNEKSYVPKEYWNKYSDFQIQKGDVVIAMTRPLISGGMKIAFFSIKEKILLNQRVGRFIIKNIDKKFFYSLLNKKSFIDQIKTKLSESGQPNISSDEIEKIKIYFPKNISEQQKIASILSNVDALIESTYKIIEKTERLKKGMMQKLLTKGISHTKFKKVSWLFGKEIEIPEEWEIKSTSEILKITMGQSPSSKSYNEACEGLPFYQGVTDFGATYPNPTVWCTEPKKIAKENSILFSVRAPVGEINLTKTKCCLGRGVAALNPLENNLWYCYYLLNKNKKNFLIYSSGTTYDAINRNEIDNVKLSCTTNTHEQQKIASILSGVDAYIQKTQEYKEKLDILKKGLMQKLLTGQIRV